MTSQFLPRQYDAWYETPLGRLCDRLEKKALFSMFKPDGLALDAACGTGNYTCEAAGKGAQAVGMDISFEMASFAKQKALKAGLRLNFVVGNMEAMPFKDNVFDCAIEVAGLCFASNTQMIISEMRRIIKPGGALLLGELNSRSYWAWLRKIKGYFRDSGYRGARFLSAAHLKKILEKTGFRDIRWKTSLYFPPVDSEALLKTFSFFEAAGSAVFRNGGAFISISARK